MKCGCDVPDRERSYITFPEAPHLVGKLFCRSCRERYLDGLRYPNSTNDLKAELQASPALAAKVGVAAQQSGWLEWKKIRGYGPYPYWRWIENGRRRSQYLGKTSKYL